jgi:hypothetical protein
MPFTDSDLRALQPQSKKYRVSAGESLFVEVYPNGGRYFVWRHRFPPGKEGKLRDYQIGPYGKGPGQWTLKEAGLIQSVSQALLPGLRAWVEVGGIAPFQCSKASLPQPISI